MDHSQPSLLELMKQTSRSDSERRPAPERQIDNNESSRQGVLFIGKDDEPGQGYLFGTKGF